jgi:hypothetical protein
LDCSGSSKLSCNQRNPVAAKQRQKRKGHVVDISININRFSLNGAHSWVRIARRNSFLSNLVFSFTEEA